jgi:translation elongation factor EF-G
MPRLQRLISESLHVVREARARYGHLDHGKSTLSGRLRAELGLPHERPAAAELREWAFAMDRLAEEQRDGMTLETAQAATG